MKSKSVFFCRECGFQSSSWIGKCPQCNYWNSFVEEVVEREVSPNKTKKSDNSIPLTLKDIECKQEHRLNLADNELNRVLGGGLVENSIVLLGGEPGIGKSTLLLQMALSAKNIKILYISGEESLQQIKMRAERMQQNNDNLYLLNETNLENIITSCDTLQPQILVIDSIQTITTSQMQSSSGSISQVRECTALLQQYTKTHPLATFLIGHITKDGQIAGPKILEHIVDCVLQFEGDRNYGYRIVRSIKNRFGSTQELGIYEMQSTGLRQVANPSEILLSQRSELLSGTATGATIEGTRAMLIEMQALVSQTGYSQGQRTATGFDSRRMQILLAVMEKKAGIKLFNRDVFLNVAGGLKIDEPAMDLAVVASCISSLEDLPINHLWCFAAEVGLTGELRGIIKIEQRIQEAAKLGFEKIFISKYNYKQLQTSYNNIEVLPLATLDDLITKVFR